MSARLIAGWLFGQQSREPDRFVAEFLTNQALAARCLVSLVEKQVERLQNAVEAAHQFLTSGNLKTQIQFANPLPRTDETFLDGGFAREKRRGDLTRTKTAKRFKR